MQDFPLKDQNNLSEECGFENDLIDYLNTLKVLILVPCYGDFLCMRFHRQLGSMLIIQQHNNVDVLS